MDLVGSDSEPGYNTTTRRGKFPDATAAIPETLGSDFRNDLSVILLFLLYENCTVTVFLASANFSEKISIP